MISTRFEPAIAAVKRSQTHALGQTATGIYSLFNYKPYISYNEWKLDEWFE